MANRKQRRRDAKRVRNRGGVDNVLRTWLPVVLIAIGVVALLVYLILANSL